MLWGPWLAGQSSLNCIGWQATCYDRHVCPQQAIPSVRRICALQVGP